MAWDALHESACGLHKPTYEPTCGACVWRYMDQLIQDDYVPRHVYEQQGRELRAAEARGNSYLAEAEYYRSQVP